METDNDSDSETALAMESNCKAEDERRLSGSFAFYAAVLAPAAYVAA